MKKLIASLLALMMLMTCIPALADNDTLNVGTTTAMTGSFLPGLFGGSTSDIDVQELLHGYSLTKWDAENGTWIFNDSVVKRMTGETVNGNRRWNLYIRSGLTYSDGSPITAWDYAFSILLSLSPEAEKLGASISGADHILGSADYRSGAKQSLRGLRVLDNNHIIITVDGSHTPDFYELGLLNYRPLPIKAIAPGCKVVDGEVGCRIEGGFTADLLAKTLIGYASAPEVVSGPYTLQSFDAAKNIAVFEKNPHYLEEVAIARIEYKLVSNDQIVPMLEKGELDLINKVTRADVADAALALAAEGKVNAIEYPRSGLSFISFSCERVADPALRQAIAHCLDQAAAVEQYVGGYGEVVNGFYGVGQWMAQRATEEDLAALPSYAYDVDAAKALLNGKTYELTLIYPEGNEAGDFLEKDFVKALAQAGITLNVEAMPFRQLLQVYYRQVERDVDMIYLASNFGTVYDPSNLVDPADAYQGVDNRTGIADEELYRLAVDLRKTQPGDVETYVAKWLAFQTRWMELVPAIPVYSNLYHDFCSPALTGFDPTAEQTWSQAILGAELTK